MTPFLLYIGRSSLYLALFYAFFLLVMRRTTFFRLNRFLLLVGTLACFLLPLLRLRTVEIPGVMAGVPIITEAAQEAPSAQVTKVNPWMILYAAGFLAVLAWTVVALVRMRRTIRKGEVRRLEDGTKLVLTEADVPSFSWGRTIVMSRKDAEANPAILQHEKAHVQKVHTLDILLFTAVTLVHWFNPLVWITLSELKLLHEYEADDAVLNKGIDATQYQLLLVRKAVGDKRFTLANGFQHAKLKNRIDMMLKNPTSGWQRLAWLAVLPFLAGTMFLCNPVRAKVVSDLPEILSETVSDLPGTVAQVPDTTQAVPFSQIDVKPTFNGSDASAFGIWVNENLQYPKTAVDAGAQGRVVLQFVIGKDGKIGDAKVLRGVHPDLDAEALRVVSASPDWTPGYVQGEPVKVMYTFPVIFRLRGNQESAPVVVSGSHSGAGFTIRGSADSVLVLLDGKEIPSVQGVDPATIESINVLRDQEAVRKYGKKASHGAIEITSKKQ